MGDSIPVPSDVATDAFPELAAEAPTELVAMVREGLPVERFDALRDLLGFSTRELAAVVGITPSTLSRRRSAGTLKKDESERVLRIAHLVLRAIEVLDGEDHARKWLTEPVRALGGETPLRFADTEPGAREVERLLGRLEHGVFS